MRNDTIRAEWQGRGFVMNMLGINSALAGAYQYAASKDVNKTGTCGTDFISQLKKTGEAAEASRVDAYTEYLRSKYGNVRIQSVGKDQQSLDRIGKSMSGSDVVIAPNILEQMASDSEKAAYYEGKIDAFFHATPRLKASFAAQGLDYQPCGVVVHEDGSVTYIGGCADSPERVAEVNAINKAKREKEAAQRKENMERSREAADAGRITQILPHGRWRNIQNDGLWIWYPNGKILRFTSPD